MASEYTPNYNLDKYVGTDKPNLRDQYNSAMDKIDAQFVKINNESVGTANQIAAINVNMGQLGDRVTAAEGGVAEVKAQVQATNTELANVKATADGAATKAELNAVKTTADNAMSLAGTNETDIGTLDGEMATAQSDILRNTSRITTLENASKSLVLYDLTYHETSETGGSLSCDSHSWETADPTTLLNAIPAWAKWLDVYVNTQEAYWKSGATAFADTIEFMSPLSVMTFPLDEWYIDNDRVMSRRVSKFSAVYRNMGVVYKGTHMFQEMHYPFMINGKTLTQQGMGLASTSTGGISYAPFSNGLLGYNVGYEPNGTSLTVGASGALLYIYKIVARA